MCIRDSSSTDPDPPGEMRFAPSASWPQSIGFVANTQRVEMDTQIRGLHEASVLAHRRMDELRRPVLEPSIYDGDDRECSMCLDMCHMCLTRKRL